MDIGALEYVVIGVPDDPSPPSFFRNSRRCRARGISGWSTCCLPRNMPMAQRLRGKCAT